MLLRCTTAFETREMGYPQQLDEGTVWYRQSDTIVPGGYECANLLEIVDGEYASSVVRVRIEHLSDNFEQVDLNEIALPLPPWISSL